MGVYIPVGEGGEESDKEVNYSRSAGDKTKEKNKVGHSS